MSPQELIGYEEKVGIMSKEELIKEYCNLSKLIAKWDNLAYSWESCKWCENKASNDFESTIEYLNEKMFIVQERMYHIFENRMLANDVTIPLSCFNNNLIVLDKELIKIINEEKYHL